MHAHPRVNADQQLQHLHANIHTCALGSSLAISCGDIQPVSRHGDAVGVGAGVVVQCGQTQCLHAGGCVAAVDLSVVAGDALATVGS